MTKTAHSFKGYSKEYKEMNLDEFKDSTNNPETFDDGLTRTADDVKEKYNRDFVVNANFLKRHYKAGYTKALEEVEKMIDERQKELRELIIEEQANLYIDKVRIRFIEGGNFELVIFKQQLKELKEKKEQ